MDDHGLTGAVVEEMTRPEPIKLKIAKPGTLREGMQVVVTWPGVDGEIIIYPARFKVKKIHHGGRISIKMQK